MITTYSGLLTELTRLIDGEDVSASEVPAATLAQIVYMGEKRLYRDLRTRYNEKAWGITTTGNLATMPADFIAPSVIHFGKAPLIPVAENTLLEYLEHAGSGQCKFYCESGPALQFAPAVANGTVLQGRYFCALPALSVSTLPSNALFAAAEDLFIYAALTESAPFFGQDARIQLWNAKYDAILKDLNRLSAMAAFGSGRIRRGTSTRAVV
jgi:hypothetical protein